MLIAVCCMGVCLVGCGNGNTSDHATPDEDQTIEATEEPLVTYEINTKYAVLKYPERWKDTVTVKIDDGEPYTVSFLLNDVKVFDLFFNGEQGDIIGTLDNGSEKVLLSVNTVKVDKNSDNYQTYCDMQEDVNVILKSLGEDYTFIVGVDAREDEPEVYAIETSLTDLYYPVKWREKVTVDVSDELVKFSCNGTPLFDLSFGGEKGILIGSYDGKEIRVIDYPLEDEEMKNMQEDVNVILSRLMKDEKFVLA